MRRVRLWFWRAFPLLMAAAALATLAQIVVAVPQACKSLGGKTMQRNWTASPELLWSAAAAKRVCGG